MKIGDQEKKNLLEKLAFLKNVNCLCGAKNWLASDTIFELREFNGGNFVIGGQASLLPVISVQCQECSQIVFFNALSMGLISQKDEKKD